MVYEPSFDKFDAAPPGTYITGESKDRLHASVTERLNTMFGRTSVVQMDDGSRYLARPSEHTWDNKRPPLDKSPVSLVLSYKVAPSGERWSCSAEKGASVPRLRFTWDVHMRFLGEPTDRYQLHAESQPSEKIFTRECTTVKDAYIDMYDSAFTDFSRKLLKTFGFHSISFDDSAEKKAAAPSAAATASAASRSDKASEQKEIEDAKNAAKEALEQLKSNRR